MFAVIKDHKVVGFITDEEQKQFLLDNESGVSFAEFDWDTSTPDNYIYPDDLVVNEDGSVTVQKAE